MEPFEQEEGVSLKPVVRRTANMKCLIILSVLLFTFLVISIVFIALYLTERSGTSRPKQQCSSTSQKYCGSKSCLFTAQGKIYCISGHENHVFDNAELLVTFHVNYSPSSSRKALEIIFRAENWVIHNWRYRLLIYGGILALNFVC